jgi:hypothetical protein
LQTSLPDKILSLPNGHFHACNKYFFM